VSAEPLPPLRDLPDAVATGEQLRDPEHHIRADAERIQTGKSHERLVQVLDEVDDLVMVGRLGGGLLYANEAAAELVPGIRMGVPLASFTGLAMQALGNAEIEPSLRAMRRWTGDLQLRLTDGHVHELATTVTPVASGEPDEIYFGIIMRDVSAERRHARALAHQARIDHLTGLPNRLALLEDLEERRVRGEEVAVLFVDIDNLKIVNDGLGHGAGDRLLAAIAEALGDVAEGDLLARFGGDEFVIITDGGDRDRVMALADDLLSKIAAVKVPDIGTHLTASLGVSFSDGGSIDPEGLLRDADAAMYEAKRRGRAGAVYFDQGLRERAQRRFTVERSMRAALADGSVEVHFQPIVDVETGEVQGFEALSRWGDRDPEEFITMAEESGLVVALGEHVLALSLAALAAMRSSLPGAEAVRMSVNVSGRQLLDRAFAHRTLDQIHEFGLAPNDVILELTETVLIDPREEVDRALRLLRDQGVALALDDFGSGYSSLAYLRRYPIDALKLDNSYTQALLHDPDTRIITEAMVTMAQRLGLRLVAEGVETASELNAVRDLGISSVQGYLVGRAARLDDVMRSGLTPRPLPN